MRFSAIFTAVMFLLGGVVEVDRDQDARPQQQAGYSAEGDGFYIWDEDCDAATEWASQLEESSQKTRSR